MHAFPNQQPPDIQALFSQFLAQLPSAQLEQPIRESDGFPDIRTESRTHVPTITAARWLNRKEQTLRGWACFENGPLLPLRLNGRLAWSVDSIRRLLGVTQMIPQKHAQSATAMAYAAHDATSIDSQSNLIAFSSQARCALEGVRDALAMQPKAKELTAEQLRYGTNRTESEDVAAEVLQDVAMKLGSLSEAIADRPSELDKLEGTDHE